jgi:DinB superfamily
VADSYIDPTVLDVLDATPRVLRELCGSASEDGLATPMDKDWSPKHIVAHILDVEDIAFMQRIRRIVEEDRPFIRSIQPTERIDEAGYMNRPVADLLDELQRRRGADITWVRSIEPSRLNRIGDHDEAGEITASNIVHYWATHDLTHLHQLALMLRSRLAGRVGNMQRFFEEV